MHVCISLKATFVLGDTPVLASTQRPVSLQASFRGAPNASSLVEVVELGLPSAETSVVLIGDAWAPGAHAVTQLQTTLEVAGRRKTLHVTGDRVWRSYGLGWATQPKAFTRMPLVYERAFGGMLLHAAGEAMAVCADNPLGTGFRGPRRRHAMNGVALANIVDPSDARKPAGYGFVPPHWPERLRLMGTYDAAWVKTRAPRLPDDFERRSGRVAPVDLCFETPLVGGETVTLIHLTPQAHLRFALPALQPTLSIGAIDASLDAQATGDVEQMPMGLEQVVLRPSEGVMTLLYQAFVPFGGRISPSRPITIRCAALPCGGAASDTAASDRPPLRG